MPCTSNVKRLHIIFGELHVKNRAVTIDALINALMR